MGPHAIKPVVAAPTRALPELRSDQVRTRRCNCNGHNTARALGCTLQLGVADSPPSTTGRQAQIMQQDRPTHARQRPRTDGTVPLFLFPFPCAKTQTRAGRPSTKDTHSVVKAPKLLAKRAGEEQTRPLAFMSGEKISLVPLVVVSLVDMSSAQLLALFGFIYSLGLRKKKL